MNTLVYLLAAFICGGLAAHSWTRNRTDPVRTAFAVVAGITGLSYLSFGLFDPPESFIYLHAIREFDSGFFLYLLNGYSADQLTHGHHGAAHVDRDAHARRLLLYVGHYALRACVQPQSPSLPIYHLCDGLLIVLGEGIESTIAARINCSPNSVPSDYWALRLLHDHRATLRGFVRHTQRKLE